MTHKKNKNKRKKKEYGVYSNLINHYCFFVVENQQWGRVQFHALSG